MHACREHMLRACMHTSTKRACSCIQCRSAACGTLAHPCCVAAPCAWGGWELHSSMKFALLHSYRVHEAHPTHAFGHTMQQHADAVVGIHHDELSTRHVGPQPSRLMGVGGAMPIYASSHARFTVVHAYCSHLKWGRWPFKGA